MMKENTTEPADDEDQAKLQRLRKTPSAAGVKAGMKNRNQNRTCQRENLNAEIQTKKNSML